MVAADRALGCLLFVTPVNLTAVVAHLAVLTPIDICHTPSQLADAIGVHVRAEPNPHRVGADRELENSKV